MRDPKRIPKIIKRLEKLWKANPELRLGQMVGNAFSYPAHNDPYYVEDEEFITKIEKIHSWGIKEK
jgi:hypothetical protein